MRWMPRLPGLRRLHSTDRRWRIRRLRRGVWTLDEFPPRPGSCTVHGEFPHVRDAVREAERRAG